MKIDHEKEAKKAMLLDLAVEQLIKIYDPLTKACEAIAQAAALEDHPTRAAFYVNYAIKFNEQRNITNKIAETLDSISYEINPATDREEEE